MGTWMETRISIYSERIWNEWIHLNTLERHWQRMETWMRRWRIEYNQDEQTGRGYRGFCATEEQVWRVKGKVYKTVVTLAMMYGAETWAVKKAQEKKLDVAEMRMLRWMSGVSCMACVEKRRRISTRVSGMGVPGKIGRGRPKRRWLDSIRNDWLERALSGEDAQDRPRWRRLTRQEEVYSKHEHFIFRLIPVIWQ